MTAGFTLRVFGMPVTVDFIVPLSDEEAAAITRAWSRCIIEEIEHPAPDLEADGLVWEAPPAGEYAAVLQLPGEGLPPRRVLGADFASFQESFTSSVTLLAINGRVGSNIMLHAAGLADPVTGGAIALIAPSGTGKTTASLRLGTSLHYLTDETVFLDGRDVLPYPKPLSVIEDPARPKQQISPDDAGLLSTPQRAPLRVLAVLERLESVDAPGGVRVARLGTIDALHALVPHMSGAPALEAPLTAILDLLHDVQGLVRITFQNGVDILPTVQSLLRSSERPYAAPRVEEVPFDASDDEPPVSAEPQYRRGQARQAAFIDDHLMVMFPDTLMEISELGEPIWSACYEWKSLSEITDYMEEELGSHPNAAEIVARAVEEMVQRGVLETRGVAEPARLG